MRSSQIAKAACPFMVHARHYGKPPEGDTGPESTIQMTERKQQRQTHQFALLSPVEHFLLMDAVIVPLVEVANGVHAAQSKQDLRAIPRDTCNACCRAAQNRKRSH
mgnify:CR=1 FL=1